jgi:Domain of unknown function DUF11
MTRDSVDIPVHTFYLRLGRLLVVATLAAAAAMTGAPAALAVPSSLGPAAVSPGAKADLGVQLSAASSLLPRIRYTVTVTNNGPQTLTSATVAVRLDPRTTSADAPQCAVDSATTTVTCPFGNLATGATATIGFWGWFGNLPPIATALPATATRISSTPPDPNSSNDTDAATCYWDRGPGLLPPYEIFC